MHDQKCTEYKSRLLDPSASSKLSTKASQWNVLSHKFVMQRRWLMCRKLMLHHAVLSAVPQAAVLLAAVLLTLTEKMLTANPYPTTLHANQDNVVAFTEQNNKVHD